MTTQFPDSHGRGIPMRWTLRVVAGGCIVWALLVLVFVAVQYNEAVSDGAPASFALGVRHQSVFSAIALPAIIVGALVGLRHALAHSPTWRRCIEAAGVVAIFSMADYFWTVLVLSAYTGVPAQTLVASTPSLFWLMLPTFTGMAYLAGAQLQGLVQRSGDATRVGRTARLAVRSAGRTDYVALDDIVIVSAQGNYVALVDRSGREVLHRATMIEMAQMLDGQGFVQVHRSHFVRPSDVVSTEQRRERIASVRLRSGQILPVSATGSAALMAALNNTAAVSPA